jgi:hypothetical protein
MESVLLKYEIMSRTWVRREKSVRVSVADQFCRNRPGRAPMYSRRERKSKPLSVEMTPVLRGRSDPYRTQGGERRSNQREASL